MTPQHLATKQSHRREVATLPPQRISCTRYLYLFADESAIVRPCRVRTALRQAGSQGPAKHENNTWRQRCPRASKHSWPLGWLPLSQPAPTPHRLKSTWSSTPSRFRPNRHTPENTSNSGYARFGQAGGPVHPITARSSASLQKGGAA